MSWTVVKKTSSALAVSVTVALVLAGCGGDAKPDASPSSTTSTSPAPTSTTAAPTKSTSPSPTSTASQSVDPNIPAAARAHTVAGAEAFVTYFHDQLNEAWGQPKAGLLEPLSLPGCRTCRAFAETAVEMVPKRERMRGDTVRIDSVNAGATESNGDQTVVVTGAQLKTAVVDSNGREVRDIPAGKLRLLVTTHWSAGGWQISEIKVLK